MEKVGGYMDDVWEDFISGLNIDLPETGILPPESEIIKSEEDDDDINGQLIKVSFDVVMFMNHDKTRYYMMQGNQKLTQLGEISLKDALLKYNKRPPRKKT